MFLIDPFMTKTPPSGLLMFARMSNRPERPVTKSDREIMEIFEAYDLTGCAHSAAQLAGCDPKTVQAVCGAAATAAAATRCDHGAAAEG